MKNATLHSFLFCILFIPLLSGQQKLDGQIESDWTLKDDPADAFQHADPAETETGGTFPGLDINHCDDAELMKLPFLLPAHRQAILLHRQKYGPYVSLFELQAVQGLPRSIAQTLQQYVTCGLTAQGELAPLAAEEGRNQLALRIGRGSALASQSDSSILFDGSPLSLSFRSRFYVGRHIQFGFFLEKDTGEPFLWRGQYKQNTIQRLSGFDNTGCTLVFSSTHKRLPVIIAGAYTLCLGQGLLVWQGFPMGKGGAAMAIQKLAPVIRPKFSPSESQKMQGLAATWVLHPRLQLTLFSSVQGRDAVITTDTLTDSQRIQRTFTAFDTDGYHRTKTEMAVRNNLHLGQHGFQLKRLFATGTVGANVLLTHLSVPMIRNKAVYKRFQFEGNQLIQASVDYRVQWNQFSVFGEHAVSQNGGLSTITGVQLSVHRSLDICLQLRYFGRNYQTLTGSTLGESSLPINENGQYAGLEWRPVPNVITNAYTDLWQHPWPGYQRTSPATGRDFLVRCMWRKKRWGEVYLQYKREMKQADSENDAATPRLKAQLTSRLRGHIQLMLAPGWQWRCRAEWSFYHHEDAEKGFQFFQDIIYKPMASNWSVTARLALFDIDGYGSRIYSYEHDVMFTSSIPSVQGQGSRFYLVLRKKWAKLGQTEIRWSATKQKNAGSESWASGQASNFTTELTGQWSWQF